MKKWIFLGVGILGMLSLTSFTNHPDRHFVLDNNQSDEITAIINKNTTEQELDDLKTFFSENNIELVIKKIAYNDQNEIVSLSIILKKGDTKSQYSSSSNTPISEIELGYKNDNLYITNSGMFDITAWSGQSNLPHQFMNMDSITKKHGFAFNFNFDKDKDSLFFKGNMDIKRFKDQILRSFTFKEDEKGNFFFNGQQVPSFRNNMRQRYNFIDNPDIEKLIIIDGKEADFNTLDTLAKSDELAEVDFLKPETAISVYGEKAKDGAIIATTKK
ncbi:hypothetical protein [Aquimarina sp. AU474]|uniref:hypothetical protein n=1 Tax=Aquimarina sp. AU474 TaxID=2108529 RepID=UPI000D69991E|nr:hypothetical protein [Aquimarina sp. AU474]